MPKLAAKHKEHLTLYGDGNEKRLTGHHETSNMHTFSFKSRNTGSSVRIPVYTEQLGYGYFEDRRPASNIDAYLVSAAMVDTICLKGENIALLIETLKASKNNTF